MLRVRETLLAWAVAVVSGQIPTSTQASDCIYSALPPPPIYVEGVFINPANESTRIYQPGVPMHISWASSFQAVNLYLIAQENYAQSLPLGRTSDHRS